MSLSVPDFSEIIQISSKCLDEADGKTPTGRKCLIRFASKASDGKPTRSDLKNAITFTVTHSSGAKVEMLWSSVEEHEKSADPNAATAYFVPLKTGEYKVLIRFSGKKLTPEPLLITAVGPDVDVAKILSKVTVHGRGFELGKAYTMNSFIVDTSAAQPPVGTLKVHAKGPERSAANLSIQDNENATYRICYKPTQPGMYTITIKIADHDIPGSPFQVRVTEFLSS